MTQENNIGKANSAAAAQAGTAAGANSAAAAQADANSLDSDFVENQADAQAVQDVLDKGGDERQGRFRRLLRSAERGEFLLTLGADRFFPHIVWFFFLICIVLTVNLMMDRTMMQAERNKAEIYDLKIYLNHRNAEFISLGRLGTVRQMLQDSELGLDIPDNPPVTLKK